MYFVSHLTYIVQLLYGTSGKCRDLNIMNLSLSCWFSQRYNTELLTAKLSPYYFYLHITPLVVCNRTITSMRCEMRLASHNHLNGEWQFHAKSHELIDAFLAFLPDWAQGPPLAMRRTRSTTAWLPENFTRLADSLQQTVDAFKFPTLVGKFSGQLSCTTPLWQMEIFNQNPIFLWNFHDFV